MVLDDKDACFRCLCVISINMSHSFSSILAHAGCRSPSHLFWSKGWFPILEMFPVHQRVNTKYNYPHSHIWIFQSLTSDSKSHGQIGEATIGNI